MNIINKPTGIYMYTKKAAQTLYRHRHRHKHCVLERQYSLYSLVFIHVSPLRLLIGLLKTTGVVGAGGGSLGQYSGYSSSFVMNFHRL